MSRVTAEHTIVASADMRMRACVLTMDLGTIRGREDAFRRRLAALTGGETFDHPSFVGLRQSAPIPDGTIGHQPYVSPGNYTRARLANTMFRLAEAPAVPHQVARYGVRLAGDAIAESILACDPDVVMLDVSWGHYLRDRLEPEFPGAVVSDKPGSRSQPFVRSADTPGEAKVSIVLPTYNGTKYIAQSIQSCLDQSYRNLEVIVVDDGSREDVSGIVARFDDRRLLYVRHEVNRGLPAALNTGFTRATGSLLTWTSDDNYYAPDAIARLVRFLGRHPSISFVYSSMFIVDELGGKGQWRVRHPLPPEDLIRQNSVGGCFMYTREVYRTIGDYDSSAVLVEDYDYWTRVSKRFRMHRLLTPLYYYRYHEQSLTSKHSPDEVARRFEVVRQQHGVA